ncbi:LytTR family DNA-binding domain-containing protein [uncultured Pseudoflavonifractor sp.]|uniref:LytR/AlgR family response regulator transcription factor n=1 Tax=uncultured Pseudoflavonifractor sp. TaxID=1221379 RepID=UPI0025FBF191|nr:LytTR family DNA-binding domain-containing protein [uncultured Pseudoflavonifractor sp.]
MYQLAICEDQEESREALCALCGDILDELETAHTVTAFPSAEALESALTHGASFDLLCLDIIMDGKSGMELARELREYNDQVSILFITSSETHLKEGYSVRPLQYLFKPVRRDELEEALKTDLRLYHQPRNLSLRSAGQTVVLPLSDILYLESRNHTLDVCTEKGRQTFWISLSEVERLLPPGRFCRCHNSYLVNMEHINQIGRREVTLSNGVKLPVSRSCYEAAQDQFVRYLNIK